MTVIPIHKPSLDDSPLDLLEDLLEASHYDFDRVSRTRLEFACSGKQGDYSMVLEWNVDMRVVKSSLIISGTQKTDKNQLNKAVEALNETSWHGFFMIDGVGNSVFKTLINLEDQNQELSIFTIEDMIDKAVHEADRLCITLALGNKDSHIDLFNDNDYEFENLELLFSDTKGNA